MTQLSNALKAASAAQDADTAAVFANILNTDQHAMKTLKGSTTYEPDDAARLSRVVAEYATMSMALTKTPTSAYSSLAARKD